MRVWMARLRTLLAALATVCLLWALPSALVWMRPAGEEEARGATVLRVWVCEDWTGTGLQWLAAQSSAFERSAGDVRIVLRRAQPDDWAREGRRRAGPAALRARRRLRAAGAAGAALRRLWAAAGACRPGGMARRGVGGAGLPGRNGTPGQRRPGRRAAGAVSERTGLSGFCGAEDRRARGRFASGAAAVRAAGVGQGARVLACRAVGRGDGLRADGRRRRRRRASGQRPRSAFFAFCWTTRRRTRCARWAFCP